MKRFRTWKENTMTDSEIIKLIRKNPDKGLSELMDRYMGTVCAVVKNGLRPYPCFSAEDAEECISDVFYEFYKNAKSFRPELGSVKTLLCVIAKHKCTDMIRKRAKEIANVSIDDGESFLQFADEFSVEEDILTEEMRNELFSEISALGQPDSEIIIRKFFFRESSASIAERLALTVSAVDTRTHRALKKLREKIGGN